MTDEETLAMMDRERASNAARNAAENPSAPPTPRKLADSGGLG